MGHHGHGSPYVGSYFHDFDSRLVLCDSKMVKWNALFLANSNLISVAIIVLENKFIYYKVHWFVSFLTLADVTLLTFRYALLR